MNHKTEVDMWNSVSTMLADVGISHPDKIALVCGGHSYTYSDINVAANKFASLLLRVGLKPGETVSLYGENSFEWLVGYYGAMRAGATVNPLNLMLTPKEVAFAVDDCGAKVILGSSRRVGPLAEVLEEMQLLACFTWGANTPAHALDVREAIAAEVEFRGDVPLPTLCSIGYTSGTTGHPKGAALGHSSIMLNVSMTALMHAREYRDVMVSALPLSHVYGNVAVQSIFARGGTVVLHELFDSSIVLQSIVDNRATVFEGVPTMYYYMLAESERTGLRPTTLTRCTVGGQTMPIEKMRQVEAALGCPLLELWGMTEIGGLGATHTAFGPRKLGTIGIALPHSELRIADPENPDIRLCTGEVGELQIKGPLLMREYFGQPEATRASLLPSGWLRTGDLAFMDEEGYVTIVDRVKDMIITAGFKIYPAELESAISEHPSVAMCAVGRIPDEIKGELAKAYVVLKPGKKLSEEELEAFCRSRLAAYKLPRSFAFVADLPKTSSGKIMRRELINIRD